MFPEINSVGKGLTFQPQMTFRETSGRGHSLQRLCNAGYPSETHLKLKSREISFTHNSFISIPIILKFCTEHGSITANFEMIVQLEQLLWTNEISRDWISRWVLDRFPILHKAPDLHTDCALCSEWENKMFSCMFNDIEGLTQDCSNSSALAMELLQSCAKPMLSSTRAASRFAPSQWEMSLQSNILSHWLGANLESALFYSSNPSQSDRPWCEDQHTHMHHVICQQRKNVTFQLDWDSTGQHSMSWTLWYHPFFVTLTTPDIQCIVHYIEISAFTIFIQVLWPYMTNSIASSRLI